MGLIYTIKSAKINHNSRQRPIYLNFFSDTHEDAKACDKEGWFNFLRECKKTPKEDTYYFGVGDYHDLASTSEKHSIRVAKLHDTTIETLDEVAMQNNRRYINQIGFMGDHLLGLVEGNHHWVFSEEAGDMSGKTSTQDLAERMGCEYLGWLCYFILQVNVSGKCTQFGIVLCHGKGGGRRAGATINGVEDLKLIFPAADLYVMGDDHQRAARPDSILIGEYDTRLKKPVVKQRNQMLCRSGSFLKSYEPDKGGYAMNKLMKPANLWGLQCELHVVLRDGGKTLQKFIRAKV